MRAKRHYCHRAAVKNRQQARQGHLGRNEFTYDAKTDSWCCPAERFEDEQFRTLRFTGKPLLIYSLMLITCGPAGGER